MTHRSSSLLLHALDYPKPKEPPFSLATASILANFHQHHHKHIKAKTWAVNSPNFTEEDVVKDVMKDNKNTDYAVGVYVWNERAVRRICASLRQHGFTGRIILGGPQITYSGKGHLETQYPHADVFIRGHAENALQALFDDDTTTTNPIPGVHLAGEHDHGLVAPQNTLDTLVSPFLTGILTPQRFMRWETQRGCPFTCSFCQHRDVVPHRRRHMNAERVTREARWFIEHRETIRDVHVVDPTFNSGPNYLDVLQVFADGGFKGKLALQTRSEMITNDFLNVIERVNCSGQVVLECGLQTIHADELKLIDRPTNLTKVTQNIVEAVRRGIQVEISLIFGLPKQSLESFKQTIVFCQELGVKVIVAYPLMLPRGTALEERKHELQLITSPEIAHESIDRIQGGSIEHVIQSPSFSYEDWKAMALIASELEQQSAEYKRVRDSRWV